MQKKYNSYLENPKADNDTAIIYYTDNGYLPILHISLISLLEHVSKNTYYDIIILHDGIDKADQELFLVLADGRYNVSIRFFDCRYFCFHLYKLPEQYPKAFYARLFVPWILKGYSRAVCLGADTIILTDIAELGEWHIPAGTYVIANNYLDTRGGTSKDCLDMDVCVLNLAKIRESFTCEKTAHLVEKAARFTRDCELLWKLAGHNYNRLKAVWNVVPAEVRYKKKAAVLEQAKVLHYRGSEKPWMIPDAFMAECWWKYARQSNYYEEILRRLCICSNDTRSLIRKTGDYLFPKGTRKRELVKKVLHVHR